MYKKYLLLCIVAILVSCNLPTEEKLAFKDDPHNFILNIEDQNSDICTSIKDDWLSHFNPDEGTSYELFITDDYFTIKNQKTVIKFLNACLFIIDSDDDRFMGSTDYLCYKTSDTWIVKQVQQITPEDAKRLKDDIDDSLYVEFKQKYKLYIETNELNLFKTVEGANLEEEQAIQFCLDMHETFWNEGRITCDYLSDKAKKMLQDNIGTNIFKERFLPFPDYVNNEEYYFSVYSSQKLIEEQSTSYYGCKVVIASAEPGKRMFHIITDKFIVAISANKKYIIASDQLNLIDESLSKNDIEKLQMF